MKVDYLLKQPPSAEMHTMLLSYVNHHKNYSLLATRKKYPWIVSFLSMASLAIILKARILSHYTIAAGKVINIFLFDSE